MTCGHLYSIKDYYMVSEVGPVRHFAGAKQMRGGAVPRERESQFFWKKEKREMDRFELPSPLVLTGNLGENWRRWEQRFQIYMTASGADGKDRKIKVAILLHALGEEALEVYNTLDIAHGEDEGEEEDEQTVNDILAAFRAYCLPKKNSV